LLIPISGFAESGARIANEFMDRRRGIASNKKYNQILDVWVRLVVGTDARNTEVTVSAFASAGCRESSFSFGTRTGFPKARIMSGSQSELSGYATLPERTCCSQETSCKSTVAGLIITVLWLKYGAPSTLRLALVAPRLHQQKLRPSSAN